ncbi:MAG: hypothetical protein Q8P66_02935 [Candidatus Colwellbacteria bacterium]|nr:hypothetical protein [Candidatus Colwellbacteria bacterium]
MNGETNSSTESAGSSTEPTATEVMSLKLKKSNFWKFLIAFAAIILLVLGGYWLWNNRLSPEAKESREMQANYDRAIAHQQQFEEAMRSDTYGGKTPEETLQLFIDALRKDDIELAYKYFILKEDGNRDPKWREALVKTKDAGKLQEAVDLLSRAKSDLNERSYEKDFKFVVREGNEIKAYVDLELNEYSGVWKIERL